MASKKWSVAVTDLTGAAHLNDISVEADNWMSALRAARQRMGEEGGVPQGASCAVSPDGVVTILDPVSRRKFVLAQKAVAESLIPAQGPTSGSAAGPVAPTPASTTLAAAATSAEPSSSKRRKFQTVAFDASAGFPVQGIAEQGPRKPDAPLAAVAVVAPSPNPPPAEPVARPRSVPPNPLAPIAAPAGVAHQAAPAVAPVGPAFASAPPAPGESGNKRRKFQTVAFDASTMSPLATPGPTGGTVSTPTPSTPPATASSATTPARVQVARDPWSRAVPVASADTAPAPNTNASATSASSVQGSAPAMRTSTQPQAVTGAAATTAMTSLQLLHQRAEEPTPKNPLTYRERSFYSADRLSQSAAEEALRAELAKLMEELAHAKRGKFVNLAVFDHRWSDRPQRPPFATLQWKDWKGGPELTFAPATASVAPKAPVSTAAVTDDRLAVAFEALQDLPFLSNAAEGMEFSVKLLSDLIPCQSVAACLYDINTDELRVVAALGVGATERKTQAVPVAVGLLGQAARFGDRPWNIPNVQAQPEFDPGLDAAPGVNAQNMLLRPLMQEGQLFGVLQLINRVGEGFTPEDANVISYIAERVAGFVRQAKLRGRH